MSAVQDIDRLRGWFAEKILGVNEFRGEHSVTVALDSIAVFLSRCHRDLGYDLLLDVSSVDHFGDDPRFEVVYELATVDDSKHLRVKVAVGEDEEIPSVVGIWPGADWHEREVWDMMGIRFRVIRISSVFSCGRAIRFSRFARISRWQGGLRRCRMLHSQVSPRLRVVRLSPAPVVRILWPASHAPDRWIEFFHFSRRLWLHVLCG